MAASLAAVTISLYTLYDNNNLGNNVSFPTRVLIPKGDIEEPVISSPEKEQPALQLSYSKEKLNALQTQLLEFSITVRRLNAGNQQQYNYRLDDLRILNDQERQLLKNKFGIDIPFIKKQQDISITITKNKQ